MASTNWRRYLGVCWLLLLTEPNLAQPINRIPDSLAQYLKTAPLDTNYLRAADQYLWWLTNPLSQWERADSLLHRMESIAKRLNDPMGLQRAYWHYGRLAYFREKQTQSLNYFKQAQRLVVKHHLPPGELQRALSGIGQVYMNINQYETALKYNLEAIKLTEKYHLTDYTVRAYLTMSNLLNLMNRPREEFEYIQKAYALAPYDQDKTMRWLAEYYMGYYLTYTSAPKKPKQGLQHMELALIHVRRYGSKSSLIMVLNALGDINLALTNTQKTFLYLKQAEQLAKQINNGITEEIACYRLGQYYQHERSYGQAESYYKKTLQLARQLNDQIYVREGTSALVQLYAQCHQYQQANEYQVALAQINDSLFSNQAAQKTRDLLTRHENEKKEAQIRLLNEQNQRTQFERNALLIGSLLIVTLAIAVAAWLLNRARLRRLEEAQQLRQQIAHDLHDEMGSTLSSISLLSSMSNDLLHQSIPAAENPELVQRMVAKIFTDSRQMQQTIDELIWMVKPGNDSLDQIAARIRAYAEPLLVSKGITFQFAFDPALERQPVSLEIRRNLYLLGKEAINNLVKHAQATQVTLRFGYGHEQLTVLIDDNGRGFDPAAATGRTGLQSMQQRASAMGGSLAIHSAPGQGTRLKLNVLL